MDMRQVGLKTPKYQPEQSEKGRGIMASKMQDEQALNRHHLRKDYLLNINFRFLNKKRI